MFRILPLSKKLFKKIVKYSLQKKVKKQLKLLSQNPKHPSLNLEILQPKQYGIYSFRIDRKFRGICFFHPDKKTIEILNITLHYH